MAAGEHMLPTPARSSSLRWGRVLIGTLRTTVMAFFCFLAIAPFFAMATGLLQSDVDLYLSGNQLWFTEAPTLRNIGFLLESTNYLTFIRNSTLVGVVVVVITLFFSLPAAYALARLTGRWGERAGILMFIVYLVPPTLLFIPLFRIIVSLGLKDSPLSLMLVYPTITVPFCTWLLMGFFKSIPPELEEAALVDGYHRFESFLRVVLPLAGPGIISVVVFSFTLTLHEYAYSQVFISRLEWRTLSTGVPSALIRGDVFFWQALLAAAFFIAIPVGLVYNLFLDRLIQGFTLGAVKG